MHLLLAVSAVLLAVLAVAAPSSPVEALDAEERAFLGIINSYRAAIGVGPLAISSQLNGAAGWMSQDMASNNYFSRTDTLGRDPFQRMADFGYTYNTWKAENITAGVATAQAAFDLWNGVPGHEANMLNPNFKVIGISRAYGQGTTYGWYWVTDFGGQVDSSTRDVLWTDVDCDSDTDAVDALKVLRQVAGLPVTQTPPCPAIGSDVEVTEDDTTTTRMWGDANCDGDVDAMDALKKLRKVAGLSVAQEAGCPEIGSMVEIPTA